MSSVTVIKLFFNRAYATKHPFLQPVPAANNPVPAANNHNQPIIDESSLNRFGLAILDQNNLSQKHRHLTKEITADKTRSIFTTKCEVFYN